MLTVIKEVFVMAYGNVSLVLLADLSVCEFFLIFTDMKHILIYI